ncbi:MAG TPA: HD domain-containing phosphohydrolase [Solirubrobacter sp.]|nr:HD domain-containing phosphohydrolase [Solirubrobacter sp.]
MDDGDALAGLRLLVAGSDLAAVQAAQTRLAALGADAIALAGDVDALARAAAASPPTAVVAVDGGDALRERLDPFDLKAGPPVLDLHALTREDDAIGAVTAARLRAVVGQRGLRARQAELEAALAAQALTRRRDAEATHQDLLQRLLRAAIYRDDNTYEHTQRVADLAARLARALGLPPHTVSLIHRAAPVHDLGKIAIPDSILLKPGRLTEEEFEVVKTHAVLGARVLAGGDADVLSVAEQIARHHHERWDGAGYPAGLQGEAIPVAARLVHLADVFDVLVHERPYKESWTVEAAIAEIERGAGTDFDPAAVREFSRLGVAGLQV